MRQLLITFTFLLPALVFAQSPVEEDFFCCTDNGYTLLIPSISLEFEDCEKVYLCEHEIELMSGMFEVHLYKDGQPATGSVLWENGTPNLQVPYIVSVSLSDFTNEKFSLKGEHNGVEVLLKLRTRVQTEVVSSQEGEYTHDNNEFSAYMNYCAWRGYDIARPSGIDIKFIPHGKSDLVRFKTKQSDGAYAAKLYPDDNRITYTPKPFISADQVVEFDVSTLNDKNLHYVRDCKNEDRVAIFTEPEINVHAIVMKVCESDDDLYHPTPQGPHKICVEPGPDGTLDQHTDLNWVSPDDAIAVINGAIHVVEGNTAGCQTSSRPNQIDKLCPELQIDIPSGMADAVEPPQLLGQLS